MKTRSPFSWTEIKNLYFIYLTVAPAGFYTGGLD